MSPRSSTRTRAVQSGGTGELNNAALVIPGDFHLHLPPRLSRRKPRRQRPLTQRRVRTCSSCSTRTNRGPSLKSHVSIFGRSEIFPSRIKACCTLSREGTPRHRHGSVVFVTTPPPKQKQATCWGIFWFLASDKFQQVKGKSCYGAVSIFTFSCQ